MGSYRSAPDLTKHSYQMSSLDHSYAVTHMCGNNKLIKGGEDIWKMQAWSFHLSHTKIILCSAYLMGMEVLIILCRAWGCTFRSKALSLTIREK